jgi:5-methylcytosine-specific restriction endonuclease McrA
LTQHPDLFPSHPRRITRPNENARRKIVNEDALIGILWDLQKGRCACGCGKRLRGDAFELDHRISVKRGGTNHRRNLQLLRKSCNRRKGSSDSLDFARRMGLLL